MDGLSGSSPFENAAIPQYRRVSLKNQKALVALSNKQLAETVIDFLRALDVGEVHVTRTCTEGVQLVDSVDFDLCYVGFALEHMGGPDFVRFIRTSETRSSRSFVTMLMPNPTKVRIHRARDAGVHEILGLPLTKRLLGERMLSMLVKNKPWIQSSGYIGPCRRTEPATVYHGQERRRR
jgi:DNA-binding response OmpR family regulator